MWESNKCLDSNKVMGLFLSHLLLHGCVSTQALNKIT